MKKDRIKPLALIGCLIVVTVAAMAYANRYAIESPKENPNVSPLVHPPMESSDSGILGLTGSLPQKKILKGGDGRFTVALNLSAKKIAPETDRAVRRVDMVIVLDRSGSMGGQKINHAKDAIRKLVERLTAEDRFALVSYSNDVRRHSPLSFMDPGQKEKIISEIDRIGSGGGTNLGGGLAEAIALLSASKNPSHTAKVVLISDGLANQGVTDPTALGRMASDAAKKGLTVTTVGVGNDFNEQLMTALADYGTGNYYYMENPMAFARVFQKEFTDGLQVAAESVKVRVPLKDGLQLADAAGYPVRIENGIAVFRTGDILSGQDRKIFLTFVAPANREQDYDIRDIRVDYRHKGENHSATLSQPLKIACVADKKAVFASYEKKEWEKQVLQNDYNQLKEEVADDIRKGKKDEAIKRIESYKKKQEVVNEVVQSPSVTTNIDSDLEGLRRKVRDTFDGDASEVRQKQKRSAKSLQFEGYQGKRK